MNIVNMVKEGDFRCESKKFWKSERLAEKLNVETEQTYEDLGKEFQPGWKRVGEQKEV